MRPGLSHCSDGELANLARAGHEPAYRELVRRHQDALFRLIRYNIGDPDEALDLLQESFVSAFAAIHRYDGDRPFRSWIARIALNKCRDWARRRKVRAFFSRARPIEPLEDFASDTPDAARMLEGRTELLRAQAAIADLPGSLREVLILRTIEEFSQADAANALGISEKAVETRLYRARLRLKEALGGTSEPVMD